MRRHRSRESRRRLDIARLLPLGLLKLLDEVLSEKYIESLEKDIRASFLDSFSDLCQNLFETYVACVFLKAGTEARETLWSILWAAL